MQPERPKSGDAANDNTRMDALRIECEAMHECLREIFSAMDDIGIAVRGIDGPAHVVERIEKNVEAARREAVTCASIVEHLDEAVADGPAPKPAAAVQQ